MGTCHSGKRPSSEQIKIDAIVLSIKISLSDEGFIREPITALLTILETNLSI